MPERLKELYERGSELFDRGRYAEAEGLLREVLVHNPRYADVLNKLGVIANLNGRLKEAAGYFEKAMRLNPRYTEAALNLAITYNDLGEIDSAAALFEGLKKERAAHPGELDPFVAGKLANEHYKLGNMYMDFNRFDDAIDQYRRALALRPGLPDIQTRLGVALREKELYSEAVSELTAAKATNPTYGPAWVQLGLTYYIQGLTGQAFEEWQRALDQIPSLKEAQLFLDIFKKEA